MKILKDVPAAYKSLIERCWSKETENRASFEMILLELSNDKEYIINAFDAIAHDIYISFIDNYLQKSKEQKVIWIKSI